MPRLSVTLKSMRDLRWQVFWYGLGLALMGAFVVYVYPSYRDQLASFRIPDALKALVGTSDYASAEGFLSAEFFSWAPLLLVVFSIMAGTSALAGEEAAGTLDLLLAQPLSRRRLALEKLLAFGVSAAGILLLICVGWLVSLPFVTIDISLWRLFLATANLLPLTLLFGTMAMAAAAALPERRAATGLTAAIAVVSYFSNYLASLVDVLRPARYGSVFHYYDGTNVLDHGLDPAKVALLLLLTAGFAILTLRSFERRDLGVRSAFTFRLSMPRL